eukprot:16441076-Heterocapsa_arctica.AAC.1
MLVLFAICRTTAAARRSSTTTTAAFLTMARSLRRPRKSRLEFKKVTYPRTALQEQARGFKNDTESIQATCDALSINGFVTVNGFSGGGEECQA